MTYLSSSWLTVFIQGVVVRVAGYHMHLTGLKLMIEVLESKLTMPILALMVEVALLMEELTKFQDM